MLRQKINQIKGNIFLEIDQILQNNCYFNELMFIRLLWFKAFSWGELLLLGGGSYSVKYDMWYRVKVYKGMG